MARSLLIVFLSILVGTGWAKADSVYIVTLNTAPLESNPAEPFAVDFQFTSGDTTSGVVNMATLSMFSFGVGGAAGTGSPFANSGNASGDLGSGVTLTTTGGSFFNEFSQYFVPGSTLSFQLDLTNNPQSGGTPDEFTFQLVDNTLGEISTTDPSGSGSLLIIDLSGSSLQPQVYSTNGDEISISPQLSQQVSTSPVPEPATFTLVLSAVPLFSLLLIYGRRREPTTLEDCA